MKQLVSKSKRLTLFVTERSDLVWPSQLNAENLKKLSRDIREQLDKIPEDDKEEEELNVIKHTESWLVEIQSICDTYYENLW